MLVEIQRLTPTAKTPLRGSEYAAGYDLYGDNDEPIIIYPHETVKIGTGIAVALPEGTFGGIFARSGLATKKGIRPSNCVGVIDEDYRGEVIVALHNDTEERATIAPHERIAQLIVIPYTTINFIEVDELNSTTRATGGFGSSGTN